MFAIQLIVLQFLVRGNAHPDGIQNPVSETFNILTAVLMESNIPLMPDRVHRDSQTELEDTGG